MVINMTLVYSAIILIIYVGATTLLIYLMNQSGPIIVKDDSVYEKIELPDNCEVEVLPSFSYTTTTTTYYVNKDFRKSKKVPRKIVIGG